MVTTDNFCLYDTRLIPASGGFIDLTSGEGPLATSHHEYAGIMVGTHMKGANHITQGGKKSERWRYQLLSYKYFLMRTNPSPMRVPLMSSEGSTSMTSSEEMGSISSNHNIPETYILIPEALGDKPHRNHNSA